MNKNDLQSADVLNSKMTTPQVISDEVNIKELLIMLWRGKLIIIISSLLSLILALAVAFSLPNMYRSEALVLPVSNGNESGLLNKFGGLASLAGVSLPNGGTDKTVIGIEILKSLSFFTKFIEEHPILVNLMAAEGWEESSNKVIINRKIYNPDLDEWVRDVDFPKKPKPSAQEAHKEFIKFFSISKDDDSGAVTISVEHFSPYVAKQWVDWLVGDINEEVRKQEVQQAQRSIDYLTQQIELTQLAEIQSGLFDLIQSQTETIMMANANPEFLFRTIDPAVAPELKAKPKRALIVAFGFVLGGMIGIVIVLTMYFFKGH